MFEAVFPQGDLVRLETYLKFSVSARIGPREFACAYLTAGPFECDGDALAWFGRLEQAGLTTWPGPPEHSDGTFVRTDGPCTTLRSPDLRPLIDTLQMTVEEAVEDLPNLLALAVRDMLSSMTPTES